jgi:hypothetical protein
MAPKSSTNTAIIAAPGGNTATDPEFDLGVEFNLVCDSVQN